MGALVALLVPALCAVLCVVIGARLAGYVPDDMFISYRYAVGLWRVAVLVWGGARHRGLAIEAAVGGTLLLGLSYVCTAGGSASTSMLALLGGSALLAVWRPSVSGAPPGPSLDCVTSGFASRGTPLHELE